MDPIVSFLLLCGWAAKMLKTFSCVDVDSLRVVEESDRQGQGIRNEGKDKETTRVKVGSRHSHHGFALGNCPIRI